MHRLGAKLALAVVLLGATLVSAQPFSRPGGPGLTVVAGGGGGVTAGTASANQCAYWTSASAIAGDADCTFDGTTFAVTTLTVGTGHATPATDDGSQLGTTALKWSDLFLALGSVINFNNGDVTITHSADTIAVAGGTLNTVAITATGTIATSGAVDINSGRHVRAGTADSSNAFYWTSGPQFVAKDATSVFLVDSAATGPLSVSVGPVVDSTAPVGTVGSGTGVTVNGTAGLRRVTYKATFTQAAFSAAATTADKTIYTLAAKQKLVSIYADSTATWTGGAVSDADMTCGKTAGGNEYLTTFDVDTATITRGLVDADLGTSINRAGAIQGGDLPSWTATTAITCRLTTVGANTDALTAGSITFYLVTEML